MDQDFEESHDHIILRPREILKMMCFQVIIKLFCYPCTGWHADSCVQLQHLGAGPHVWGALWLHSLHCCPSNTAIHPHQQRYAIKLKIPFKSVPSCILLLHRSHYEQLSIYVFTHAWLCFCINADDMLIKLWDWEKKWSCSQVFEGHTHYVMQIVINPKDNNQFASASLDRTIKVGDTCFVCCHLFCC